MSKAQLKGAAPYPGREKRGRLWDKIPDGHGSGKTPVSSHVSTSFLQTCSSFLFYCVMKVAVTRFTFLIRASAQLTSSNFNFHTFFHKWSKAYQSILRPVGHLKHRGERKTPVFFVGGFLAENRRAWEIISRSFRNLDCALTGTGWEGKEVEGGAKKISRNLGDGWAWDEMWQICGGMGGWRGGVR